MALISVRHMGLKRKLPLELLYNVIDICAQNTSLDELKALSLVSGSLNRQARKHIWKRLVLPTMRAVRLDREGKDFSFIVDALSTLPDIPSYTQSLHIVSHPPEVLARFLRKLRFRALQRIVIHGYDSRVSLTLCPLSLAKLLRTNSGIHTMNLSNFRMDPIALLNFISQSELDQLRHCTLDVINTTIDDSWDDYVREPKSHLVNEFLEKRIEGRNMSRPTLRSLHLNRITNLPNMAFCDALFRHPHSLFDISYLQRLTLYITSYPSVPLVHFTQVIEACCLSVTSLTIRNWQDVTLSDSPLILKFDNVTDITFHLYGGTGLELIKSSMKLALKHLRMLKSLKKIKFYVESYEKVEFLPYIKDGLNGICLEVPAIEELVICVKSLDAECCDRNEVFVWDLDRCVLLLK